MVALNGHCQILKAAWRAGSSFLRKSAVCYSCYEFPYSQTGPVSVWHRLKGGWFGDCGAKKQLLLDGITPQTEGFYFGFASNRILRFREQTGFGEFKLSLESAGAVRLWGDFCGRKVRELVPSSGGFPRRPFAVYDLDRQARDEFIKLRETVIFEFSKLHHRIRPGGPIRFTALLDNRRLYVRDLGSGTLDELADVQRVVDEEFRTLIRADLCWLERYLDSCRSGINIPDGFARGFCPA